MRFITLSFLFVFIFISVSPCFSQIEKPEKKTFNIGLYDGVGGINFSFFPSADISYKNTMLRLSPGFAALSAGITHEIMSVSPAYYNVCWVASAYFSYSRYNGIYAGKLMGADQKSLDNSTRYILLTGLRIYFGKRWYSILQLGGMYSAYRPYSRTIMVSGIGIPDTGTRRKEFIPYFEFGLGVNLFQTFPRLNNSLK